ncbi:MAG: metal ABC transporter solute-binding protein, Zn/Mn family [Ilumatobacteraceae bacterium]
MTTNILGQVVGQLVGDLADVEIVMPLGADPHEFEPSAQQAEAMEDADLLVINGAGFEEGMADLIEQAVSEGAPVLDAASQVELTAGDPHIWMDPQRMSAVVEGLGVRLAGVDGIDSDALAGRVDDELAELTALDAELADTLGAIPADQRVLVTNHEVLGYFADRYGFEVLGAVIPSTSTGAQASAGDLEQLAATIRDAGVDKIFAETTQSADLAEALADEVGEDVQVVELFTESLGEPGSGAETYAAMMRANARLIADGLS